MKKSFLILFTTVMMVLSSVFMVMTKVRAADASKPDIEAVKAAVKRDFPHFNITDVKRTDIDGFYELVAGPNVVYYHLKTGYMFFGEIYTKDNVSLIAKRRAELVTNRITTLPLDKAIKIGKGKHTVIEFTDVDCPYCRKAEEAFKNQSDVIRYVFLFPLAQIHPKSTAKSLEILCLKDKDRVKAYIDAISGSADNREPKACSDKSAGELLNEYISIGRELDVRGTPSFWIDGVGITGGDIKKIEELLQNKESAQK